MPIFTYFAVVGSVLIALLFVADAALEKGMPAVVTSQYGLPKRPVVTSDQYSLEKPWRPKTQKQILAAVPAPAPDMTSPLVLAAQPTLAFEAVTPAAREARAEVPPNKARSKEPSQKVRSEASAKKAWAEAPLQNRPVTQTINDQQNQFDRFSIKGY